VDLIIQKINVTNSASRVATVAVAIVAVLAMVAAAVAVAVVPLAVVPLVLVHQNFMFVQFQIQLVKGLGSEECKFAYR
jgi:hypothetical protein